MFTLFIFMCVITTFAIFVCFAFDLCCDFETVTILGCFICISIIVFMLWRTSEISCVTSEFPISQVERRLDGTIYCYTTNTIKGELKGIKIPSGVDLLTDEQIKDKVSIEWYDYTRVNGTHFYDYKLKY